MLYPFNKDELKNYIRSGKLEKVFKALDNYEGSLKDEPILIATRYERLERNKRKNIISYEQYTLERNKLENDLIALIDAIDIEMVEDSKEENNKADEVIESKIQVLRDSSNNKHPLPARIYLLSAFLLLFVALISTYLLSKVETLGSTYCSLLYVIYAVLGLAVVLLLFGAMKSDASAERKKSLTIFKIGGPILGFLLTVYGGSRFSGCPRGNEIIISQNEPSSITDSTKNLTNNMVSEDTIYEINEETVDKASTNRTPKKITKNKDRRMPTPSEKPPIARPTAPVQTQDIVDVATDDIVDKNKFVEQIPKTKPTILVPEPIKSESTLIPTTPESNKSKSETTSSSEIYVQAANINAIFIDDTEVSFEPKTEAGIRKYYFDIPDRTKCSITVKSKHYTYKYFKKQDNSIIGLRPCSDEQLCKIN